MNTNRSPALRGHSRTLPSRPQSSVSTLRRDVPEQYGGPNRRLLAGSLGEEDPGSALVPRQVETLSASTSRDEPTTSDSGDTGSASVVELLLSASQLLVPDLPIADHPSDTHSSAENGRERKPREQTPRPGLLVSHADTDKSRWGRSRRGTG